MADQVRQARISATKNQCEIYEVLAEKDEIEALWVVIKWTALANQWQKGTGEGTEERVKTQQFLCKAWYGQIQDDIIGYSIPGTDTLRYGDTRTFSNFSNPGGEVLLFSF